MWLCAPPPPPPGEQREWASRTSRRRLCRAGVGAKDGVERHVGEGGPGRRHHGRAVHVVLDGPVVGALAEAGEGGRVREGEGGDSGKGGVAGVRYGAAVVAGWEEEVCEDGNLYRPDLGIPHQACFASRVVRVGRAIAVVVMPTGG